MTLDICIQIVIMEKLGFELTKLSSFSAVIIEIIFQTSLCTQIVKFVAAMICLNLAIEKNDFLRSWIVYS
jgi:hypothetical protein